MSSTINRIESIIKEGDENLDIERSSASKHYLRAIAETQLSVLVEIREMRKLMEKYYE